MNEARSTLDAAAFRAMARSRLTRNFEAAFRLVTGLPLNLVMCDLRRKCAAMCVGKNPLCSLIHEVHDCCQGCSQKHRPLADKLAPVLLRCWAGLTRVAVPVMGGGEHVATVIAGPVFVRKPNTRCVADVIRQMNQRGHRVARRRLEKACARAMIVSEEKLQAASTVLCCFARQLGQDASRFLLASRRGETPCVAAAKRFVQSRPAVHVRTREAARHVHLSPAYFCKQFKKCTGLTFAEYVSRMHVETAKKLLLEPSLRISHVATAAGFTSLPYFNRVFKRYAGVTPRAFRASRQL